MLEMRLRSKSRWKENLEWVTGGFDEEVSVWLGIDLMNEILEGEL